MREPFSNRGAIDLSTRRARGGSKSNRTCGARANANPARLARSLRSREQKPKIFLPYSFLSVGGVGGADKNGKEIFGFASPRKIWYNNIYGNLLTH